ncbi:hypothetical protein RchiOBHm_Chr1g0380311 [Rosa chinensis]|uniref:Uncharacterized protein n=1 Tax=Rosa chinensis TaxID=74649 RepID=A0A2P6SN02_ROSCH|nr:hypothetical protein RchiOBHm_Chr1g0376921 [Rosa chinensis]PRQ60360.1 hypothetical protein RchiOBHm_Chr1g0380311 [Rosa chinensis]
MATLRKTFIWINLKALRLKMTFIKCVSFIGPSMDSSKLQGVGTSVLMMQSNLLVSHKTWMNLVFTRRSVGVLLCSLYFM